MRKVLDVISESLRSSEDQDYTAIGVRRAIILLSIPMVLEMGMEALFALVDIFFVTKLGEVATATVGLTETLMIPVYSIAWGLGMGATAVVARRTGEKNNPGASIAAAQSLLIALTIGLALALASVVFAPELLRTLGAGDDVMAEAVPYARLMLGSDLIIMLLFVVNAVFRGAGNARMALRTLALANGINIVLDPLLIFGVGFFPELGVYGAAIATCTGRSIGVLYQLYHLFRPGGTFAIRLFDLRPVREVLMGILKISLGGMGQFLIASLSWVFLVRIVASFGTVAVAGYMVAVRIIIVTLLPAWGMANAAATLVGQNLGAKQPERAAHSAWLCGHYNMVFMVCVMFFFWGSAPWIVSFFDQSPEADGFAVLALRVVSLGYFFYGYGMVLSQSLNGAGDSLTPTWLNVLCFWLVQIPLAYLLAIPFAFGPIGVFVSVAISESLLAILCAWVFRVGKWKAVQV